MKIVITGALGHIGSRLIREIPQMFPQTEIVMIDNLLTQRYCSLFNLPSNGSYHFIEEDVLKTNLNPLFSQVDVVIHLAALTDAAASVKNREEVEHLNFHSTEKVAKTCIQEDCAMIHLSSTSVYTPQSDYVDEMCQESDLKPNNPYAQTKLKEERLLDDLSKNHNFRFVNLRFGTICGISPGMRFHTAVNHFCWQAVMRQPLTVWKTALYQKRPYLDLADAMSAMEFVIKKDIFDNQTYNVLTENLTVMDIIELIKKQVTEIEIEYVDSEIMNELSYEVSNQRLSNKGFKSKGSIIESVFDTIELLSNCNNYKGIT